MGILTVEQIVSADGFAAGADGGLGFTEVVPFGDESDADSPQLRWLGTVDAILLGRSTYELFASYWPTADPAVDATAGPMAALPKHVVSRTLEHAPWGAGQAEVLRGGAVAAATAMRERYASTVVWGSLRLSEALLGAGLVDELRLRIVPVLLGAGRTFVPPNLGARALRLEDVERYDTGHLTVTYRVAQGGDAR
ncbi:dihydrofolate reductase family protein [Serinibacter arcticus]|uniref:Dihydrofolate reductase n=1 Tax=Serinibacter arcticus TaxID=1655435 RepID=A0A4Z1E2P8_9MICO|nr:dihydrofolate reductase family protein [Serinibacter arcticus]TGO04982.1 Dihydrofolate reductase [Serinibacter arcticus]